MASNTRKVSRSNPSKSKKNPSHSLTEAQHALGLIRGLEGKIESTLLEMQEKVHQLEQFNKFSALLNSTLDTATVREKALEGTCNLLRCETASLLLVDPLKAELNWDCSHDEFLMPHSIPQSIPINDRSIVGHVAMSGESVICNDFQNDPRSFKYFGKNFLIPTEFKAQTLLCVPLKARERTVGVLLAFNKLATVPAKSSMHSWPDFYEEDRKILETLSHQVAIAIENSRLYTDLKKGFFDTVEALAEAIEKKDRYTGGHTKRVVYYSMCVAKYMDLSHEQLEQVHLAAILHDVGKIGVEDSILKKQSALTKEEWVVMKSHPEQGYDIMSRVKGLKDVIGGMRYHHERWDGKGYPLGLKGEEIPLIARIIAVADTYDAMVSTRPYRKGLDPQVAYDEIVLHSGSQFDPSVVIAFIEAFRNEKMGKGSGGSSLSYSLSPSPLNED